MGNPMAELGLFSGCQSGSDARAVLRAQVVIEVEAMLALVADLDTFDIIELIRMREFPLWTDPAGGWDGTGLTVELVSATMLARPARRPDGTTPREDTRPHEVIPELHDRCLRLGRLGTYRQLFEGNFSPDPLSMLAAEYQAAVLNIRNLQYSAIRNHHEQALFGHPKTEALMTRFLGYTYPDLVAVREAVSQISSKRMSKLRDDSADVLMRYPDTPPSGVPREAMGEFMAAMVPFMFIPGDRAAFTAEEVAAEAGISEGVAVRVLESYAQPLDDSRTAVDRVYEILVRTNPFLTQPLVTDSAGTFVSTSGEVGLDSLRRVFEDTLKVDQNEFRGYDKKVRQVVSESLTMEALENLLKAPPKAAGFRYFAPSDDLSHAALDADCTDLNAVGKPVEGDGLFVVGDVAVCVEVKGKSMTPQTRRGDLNRLWADLKATVGHGCKQALRLQNLIESNGGIWLEDGTWMDLSGVREVRSVVALLDDVGPLGTHLGELQKAGILPRERAPWVTSIHDLETISLVCDRPSEFLLYLRRRADSEVAQLFRTSDELDLFMLFMNAHLYVEPNPDEVRAKHPTAPPVKNADRRRHDEDFYNRIVDDQCYELNVWMARDELGPDDPRPQKPTYNAFPEMLDLIDLVERHGGPDMLRFGADMLALSGDAQRKVLNGIRDVRRLVRTDGEVHRGFASFAGTWGHPSLFYAARPAGADLIEVQEQLVLYMRAKRHQLKSDRAYGFVLDAQGDVDVAIYFNTPTKEDSDLDRLVVAMGLHPVGDDSRTPVPPSAKRKTRRLRGKKRRR